MKIAHFYIRHHRLSSADNKNEYCTITQHLKDAKMNDKQTI